MTLMKCEQCGRRVDDSPCPFCQSTRVRPLQPGETAVEEAAPPPRPRAEKVYEPTPERQAPPPLPRQEQRIPPQQPPQSPPAETAEIPGLADFETLLTEKHFSAVILCGMSQSGKSEIASGFTRANAFFRGRAQVATQRSMSKNMYTLGGTNPGEVWSQPVNTRRKIVFLDPSGEFFRRISPTERQRLNLPNVTPEHFRFVRAAVEHLAGIVLVVDLTKTLDELAATPWLNQELDLDFTLSALRYLRYEKNPDATALSLASAIASSVQELPRLDVPVLVLFSKADRLDEITPQRPLAFARRRLPRLHSALVTHTRRFRFDFVHTMTRQTAGDDRQVERPCGVLLSMEWLLSDPFRWMPSLPTRFLEMLG